MLASFFATLAWRVYLRPTENCPMDQHVGRWLHGLLFYLIQQDNPGLATAWHETERKTALFARPASKKERKEILAKQQ